MAPLLHQQRERDEVDTGRQTAAVGCSRATTGIRCNLTEQPGEEHTPEENPPPPPALPKVGERWR